MNREFFMKNLWLWKCEMPEKQPKEKLSFGDLSGSEWSPEFEILRRNRLIMGAFRYGLLKDMKPGRDNIGSIKKRCELYIESGNTEYLVDIANIAMCEFILDNHPNKHFAAIDDGTHIKGA